MAPSWTVKDVAVHLLDTHIRRLSMARRGSRSEPRPIITSAADLVSLVNRLNREGVEKYRSFGPEVLISMMETASRRAAEHFASLDPFGRAPLGVSWAGEETSLNWFDTAREFTERWHHQQQIRLATGRPGIMTRELYYPVLDCFMRALPFTYRDQPGEPGTHARFNVSGDCGGSWFLHRDEAKWRLIESAIGRKASETTIPQEIAWRIFTKGIDAQSAEAQVTVDGDRTLGLRILRMVSIVG